MLPSVYCRHVVGVLQLACTVDTHSCVCVCTSYKGVRCISIEPHYNHHINKHTYRDFDL